MILIIFVIFWYFISQEGQSVIHVHIFKSVYIVCIEKNIKELNCCILWENFKLLLFVVYEKIRVKWKFCIYFTFPTHLGFSGL